jgi:hypothetical protein
MARTIEEIKTVMTSEFVANSHIVAMYGLDKTKSFDEQFSKVSLESIFFYVLAAAIWTLENLFDTHKKEVSDIILNQKPHTAKWYANRAKAFQHGYDLPDESDLYDNTGISDDLIAQSRIVTHAAAVEESGKLTLKVAKNGENDDLQELSADELTEFKEYMARIKDAGVNLVMISEPADTLVLNLTVYYNPLVLQKNSTGELVNILSQEPVIKNTVRQYLRSLPFNGTLVLAYLVDKLQGVDGVVIPQIDSAQAGYNGRLEMFTTMYNPLAGYTRVSDNDLIIEAIPQTVIN